MSLAKLMLRSDVRRQHRVSGAAVEIRESIRLSMTRTMRQHRLVLLLMIARQKCSADWAA